MQKHIINSVPPSQFILHPKLSTSGPEIANLFSNTFANYRIKFR